MIDYYRLEHEHNSAKNTVVVNWCLLNVCNYKCSYCPKYLHDGSTGFPDLNKVEIFCSQVIDHYEGKDIYFEFTGGEVTFWIEFLELVEFLKSHNNVYVGVISNGSNSLKWWDAMKDKLDNVCLSFQPEFSKKDHYIKVVQMISKHLRTHVNFMMHTDHFDKCIDVVTELVETTPNISVALQPLLVDFRDKLYEYTSDQLKIIDKQFELFGGKVKWTQQFPIFRGAMKAIGDDREVVSSAHRFISEKVNRWKGWVCHAGLEQIVVDTNGRVWRGWCLEGGTLGDIDGYVNLPETPIICDRDYCHCNFDIMCTKEKV